MIGGATTLQWHIPVANFRGIEFQKSLENLSFHFYDQNRTSGNCRGDVAEMFED